jgi:hypothetical protein
MLVASKTMFAAVAILTAALTLPRQCSGSAPKPYNPQSTRLHTKSGHHNLLSNAQWVCKGSLDDTFHILGWLSDREILIDRPGSGWNFTAYNWITRHSRRLKRLSWRINNHFKDAAPSSGIRYWRLSPDGKWLIWGPKYANVYATSIDGRRQYRWDMDDFAC